MAHGRSFRRAYSLRTPKSPSLLDPTYSSLEDAALPHVWGDNPETSEKAKRGRRKAASLRGWKGLDREPPAEMPPMPAEMPHWLSPDDGELLIEEAQSKGYHRMKKCKKQVDRALRRGWEIFVANLYSVTLSRPAPSSEAAPSSVRPC